MDTTTYSNTNTAVTVAGNMAPAYLMGRPRSAYTAVYRTAEVSYLSSPTVPARLAA